MADNNTAAKAAGATTKAAADNEATLKREVANLKREVTRLNKQLAEQAEEAMDSAFGWYDGAAERASRATRELRSLAQSVSETVRDNPGTHSSAMLLGGVVGLVIGLLLGQSDNRRFWDR